MKYVRSMLGLPGLIAGQDNVTILAVVGADGD